MRLSESSMFRRGFLPDQGFVFFLIWFRMVMLAVTQLAVSIPNTVMGDDSSKAAEQLTLSESFRLNAGMGQLGQPMHWSYEHEGNVHAEISPPITYRLQQTTDDRLYLTANEAFFPRLGLQAEGVSDLPDPFKLNGGKAFEWIQGWNRGESAEWGWWCERPGQVSFRVLMQPGASKSRFQIRFGDEVAVFVVEPVDDQRREVFRGELQIKELGKQSVEVTCLDDESNSRLLWIQLDGEAVVNASVIRKRWRPAAAHTRFSSSQQKGPVKIWVMEMDAVPGTLGFYSPITTPFGYYGPTWLPDGRVNKGFNFSLWSYGRGKQEPPVEQLSHLLAIGNKDASFGQFGHEGTGVKIRDWEPLDGSQGQSQVFALRVESGENYNTYFSYFYLEKEQCWQLFGIGNQFHQGKPIESLWVGSFVEVPGPPNVQRTGVYPRRMRYRGWVQDVSGQWFRLDQMASGNVDRESGLTHTNRGVSEDGWFFLETGGWGYRRTQAIETITLPEIFSDERPEYLTDDSAKILGAFSDPVQILEAERDSSDLILHLALENRDPDAKLKVFYGKHEGLTFSDRWSGETELELSGQSPHVVRVAGFFSEGSFSQSGFFRLLLVNENGQFWTRSSWEWNPAIQGIRSRE